MATTVTPKNQDPPTSPRRAKGLFSQLATTGRMPPVTLTITPLKKGAKPITLTRFLSYSFQSSIIIPVDSFSFTFVAPDDEQPVTKTIRDGDLVQLYANGLPLSAGIIDTVDIEVDMSFGEKVTITGRDLMSQLEDQDAISATSEPLWGNAETVTSAMRKLIQGTRIPGVLVRGATSRADLLFATSPGESKLAALTRFLEPINCLAWMNETGRLVIGKPNMTQKPSGTLMCSKSQRQSNVFSMKAIRNATTIPNFVVPIWSGQETVQSRVAKEQGVSNNARAPKRLRENGHVVAKSVVVSTPMATNPQGLADTNRFTVGSGTDLQAYAKRFIAQQNFKELLVQAVVPGHFNEDGWHYHTDHTYRVVFDRGDVDEVMYLYGVEYTMDEGSGQRTLLQLCRLWTIVADIKIAGEP